MVTPRILKRGRTRDTRNGRRKGSSEFSLFINKNDFNSFTVPFVHDLNIYLFIYLFQFNSRYKAHEKKKNIKRNIE